MPTFVVPSSHGTVREFNSCHVPAKSSDRKPGSFAPKGSGNCTPGTASPQKLLPAHPSSLSTGDVIGSSPLGGGANVSMIVQIQGADNDPETGNREVIKAVYKPEVGEVWRSSFVNADINRYLNNREFSLAEREAVAYEIDQLIGTNVVPETILREEVDVEVEVDDPDEVIYDEDEARREYDDWRQDQLDRGAVYDQVGEQMGELENDAIKEFVEDYERRALEMNDIWNDLVDEFPEGEGRPDYGSGIEEHPLLQDLVGREQGRSEIGFNPHKRGAGEIDPIEVLDEAGVDVSSTMSREERANVRAILYRKMVEEGYQELGDIDEDDAREKWDHKKHDEWMEEHQDTEARFLDEAIQSFSDWKQERGYNSAQGGGGNPVRNEDAPHPNGGSLQRFVKGGGWASPGVENTHRMAILDYVIGSMDRHSNNVMVAGGQGWAIDNGYSWPDGPATLRSDPASTLLRLASADRDVPAALRDTIRQQIRRTNWDAFFARHPSIPEGERTWFHNRLERMVLALETDRGLAELWRNTKKIG